MKKLLLPILLASATTMISCQGKGKPSEPSAKEEKPNTSYKPAFKGQTRIAPIKTSTPYNVEVLTKDLGKPWGIINLPDGKFLITEKSGFMNVVSIDGKQISKIEGFPKVDSKGQGGMLDVALDPNFKTNNIIYFSYSEPYEGGNHTAVAKGKLSPDLKNISEVKVIFRATPTYNGDKHYGSRLVFDKDGNLFVSTGERSDKETRVYAQKTDNYLGKILKITKDGKPAPGNPFIGKTGYKPEIYAFGIRNPQGLAMDEKGQLWDIEMGPRGGDEINLIQPGKNYGWGDVTYGIEYSGDKINNGTTQKEGTEQPVYYWDPVVSPSGVTFYTGNIDEWKNNLFIACLSGQHINRIVMKDNKVVGEERLLLDQKERFRDVLNGSDRNLYGITDSGKLYKISKK
ncbi:PQQ-dependent sugar dehydrogenase [Chryseobacterium indoltheticum]|uniref:Glucose/arabinose dehydrogenase, beta-propeller fold n=1 Tax=Chryseobacterium indoltheticum TaxID=254 RepID=A0A381F621_9FLAO|nr:PQQ-dependent sugar dehydrogenase [Chryseobacterium indoltheticum]SIQ88462.1 Glucose/arabinose dehydrogenase, beta-propeller fold [Chryseobacterium indoltheticum]SUX41943.1 Soluble aldose sugar dehydrogenase yliI precursor [Chryseobacterium indoltheticum]